MSAIAEFHNLEFVNLVDMTIPQSVVEMVPGIGRARKSRSAAVRRR